MPNDERIKQNLLRIGTVFQIFFIDTLASGKKPGDLTKDDWKNIAEKVYEYAAPEDGQKYSEFVFTLYADYIDISAAILQGRVSEKNLASIRDLSVVIRENTKRLNSGEISEVAYIEACLWLSLEAMMKLLSAYFTSGFTREYADLVQSASQLAYEYGRYALYSKEQEILDKYLQDQHALDERLQKEYVLYMAEVQERAGAFQRLIEDAFSSDIGERLRGSAELARAVGVKEEEVLNTVEDVDSFFMD